MDNILEEIPINIKNQHQLLNLLAEGYKSLSKALMEYIDNSFDSADDFFEENGRYKRDVKIAITIDRRLNNIYIQDNCSGMSLEKIKGLANSINESEKRRREQKRAWVNGQFGLGAHAYRFFAQTLVVISKEITGKQVSISIDRDDPYANLIKFKDFNFQPSGTSVRLQDIDRNQMRSLSSQGLQKEIELYFEMLLNRNVEIKIIDGDEEYICKPFDYDVLEGIAIKKTIDSWEIGSSTKTVPQDKGINVSLKVCFQKIDHPPFFSRKGRKINNISNMDSFIRKTQHRKKVWENYYLTGYIEVGENLEPVLTRDDFQGGRGKTQERTAIYAEIIKLEDDIYRAIESINKDRSDESFKQLASRLTDLLSELANEEEVRLRYQNEEDKTKKGSLQKIINDKTSLDEYEVIVHGHGEGHRGENGHKKIVKGDLSGAGTIEGRKISNDEKKGIRIEFSTLPSEQRSHCGDGIITIFTDHQDFKERKGREELEQMVITSRLSSYLSAVISSEYKEIFYQQKKLEPSRKLILDEQIDFIFRFEQRMKDLINRPLDTLGKIKE